MNYERLWKSIKDNEGFDGMPYRDTEGFLTIGYGAKLPITEYEAAMVSKHRLNEKMKELKTALAEIGIDYTKLPDGPQEALAEMAFQLGVAGVMGFKWMLLHVTNGDWEGAAREALDSRWAKQTPARAARVAAMLSR